MTNSSLHRARAAVLALGLVVGTIACSSDGSGADQEPASSTDASSASIATESSADPVGADASDVTETEPSAAPDAEGVDCQADQQAGIDAGSMSRSVTVLFSADSNSGVASADITAETTMTIQADGALSPDALTVSVGQVFGIMPAEGSDIDAVKIGCADAQTLLPGSPAGFVIEEPGTYTISLEIAGTELGTVTAE
jgi:hypothetical protein